MTDSEIISLFFERSEQAIDELAKNMVARWQEWQEISWETNKTLRSV